MLPTNFSPIKEMVEKIEQLAQHHELPANWKPKTISINLRNNGDWDIHTINATEQSTHLIEFSKEKDPFVPERSNKLAYFELEGTTIKNALQFDKDLNPTKIPLKDGGILTQGSPRLDKALEERKN